jgi:RNA polymerase sigma-70 factor (ECF subfamily)
MDMEDARILALLWDRSESAINALAAKFGRRLLQTATNILGDARDAEEAVSDTYLALWNVIPPERPEPLSSYIYKVGRNIALKQLRARSAQKRCGNYAFSLDELSDVLPSNSLEEQLDARALGQAIDAFLDTLTKEDRALFVRRYWFGDSVTALSVQRMTTAGNISVRLYRIREKLKTYLQKEGIFL